MKSVYTKTEGLEILKMAALIKESRTLAPDHDYRIALYDIEEAGAKLTNQKYKVIFQGMIEQKTRNELANELGLSEKTIYRRTGNMASAIVNLLEPTDGRKEA